MTKENIPETENCGKTDCGCANSQDEMLKNAEIEKEEPKEEKTLDPTHFGDWQVGCRAIDF